MRTIHLLRAICPAVATAAALTLTACGPTPPPPAPGGAKTGVSAAKAFGFAGPLTGENAQFGIMLKQGAQLALDEINQAGGLKGPGDGKGTQVQGFFEDDAANPKEAASVAQKLASNPNVVAVIGHFNSSCSLAGKPIYAERKVVQLTPASTNTAVCRGSDWTFRNIYDDAFQGQTLATYAKKVLKLDRVAIFYDNDDYGIGLKDSFTEQARADGLEVVFTQAYKRETTDYRPHLAKFQASKPQAIMIAGLYAQGALIARQARELGISIPLLGGDGMLSDQYMKLAEAAADNTYISCPFLFDLGGEKATKFRADFQKKFGGEPDAWSALAYDAVHIIAAAVRKVGWDRQKIRDHLATMTRPDMAYPGITGSTYFDKNGDCKKPIQMGLVKDGKIVPATQQMP